MIRHIITSATFVIVLIHPIHGPFGLPDLVAKETDGVELGLDVFEDKNHRDPNWSRADQLKVLRAIAEKNPYSLKLDEIEEKIIILERMVIEEVERNRRPPMPPREMTEQERIADLIYRLRDQDDFGSIDYWDRDEYAGTPARILISHGYAAVPQLIDALGDDTFTRCRHLVTVGECAGFILNEIAGKELDDRRLSLRRHNIDGVRREVAAWWKRLVSIGEKQVLIEDVEAADLDSLRQANRLAARYPEVAFKAIRKSYRKSKQSVLIRATRGLKGKEVEEFLNDALRESDLGLSLAAAIELRQIGSPNALKRMIEQIRVADAPATARGLSSEYLDFWCLVQFLADGGRPEAYSALAEAVDRLAPELRVLIIRSMCRSVADSNNPISIEARSAAIRLFCRCLEDLSQSVSTHRDSSFVRVCDVAAESLAMLRKCPEVVSSNSPFRRRERQRLALLNEWRKEHGLASAPAYEAPRPTPVPVRIVNPLLNQYLCEKTEDGKTAISAKIEALGLGALPAIRNRLKTLGDQHPDTNSVAMLAGRVSFTVVDFRFCENGVQIPDNVRKSLGDFKHKPLPLNGFQALIDACCRGMPQTCRSRVFIDRSNDLGGAIIHVTWSIINDRQPDNDGSWQTRENIALDGKLLILPQDLSGNPEHSLAPLVAKAIDREILIQFDVEFRKSR